MTELHALGHALQATGARRRAHSYSAALGRRQDGVELGRLCRRGNVTAFHTAVRTVRDAMQDRRRAFAPTLFHPPSATAWLRLDRRRLPLIDAVGMMQLTVDSAAAAAGIMQIHKRDLRDDFRRLASVDIDRIDKIHLITDSDQSKMISKGWYDVMRFTNKP